MSRGLSLLFSVFLCVAGFGCSPGFDPNTAGGKAAILERTRLYLDISDCANAIASIEGLYESDQSDNEVRQLRASAHACSAGIPDLTSFMLDLITRDLIGSAFWSTMSEIFYNASGAVRNTRVINGWYGIDALQAMVTPGSFVLPAMKIAAGTNNVGSIYSGDRTAEANIHLMFVAMASIGSLQNVYGAPDTTFNRGQKLGYTLANPNGWAVASALDSSVDPSGCSYVAAILNMLDAIEAASGTLPSSVAETMNLIEDDMSSAMAEACDAGCQGNGGGPITIDGYAMSVTSGCGLPADYCETEGGRPCPLKLRDRTQCTGAIADPNSCAAAGIIQMINEHPIRGWQ